MAVFFSFQIFKCLFCFYRVFWFQMKKFDWAWNVFNWTGTLFCSIFFSQSQKLYFELVMKLSDVRWFFKKVYLIFLFMFKFFIVIIRFNLSGERFLFLNILKLPQNFFACDIFHNFDDPSYLIILKKSNNFNQIDLFQKKSNNILSLVFIENQVQFRTTGCFKKLLKTRFQLEFAPALLVCRAARFRILFNKTGFLFSFHLCSVGLTVVTAILVAKNFFTTCSY